MASTFSLQNRFLVITIFVVSSLFFIFSTEAGTTMFGLFKKYDVHLSPQVYGVITNSGEPVAGIKVFRGLTYGDDKELIDETLTDEQGRFSFSEKNIRSRKPGSMFDESRVRQLIDVDYQGKQFLLWGTIMIGIEPNAALSEKLSQLSCDLNNSEEYFEFKSVEYPNVSHGVQSICRWK